MYMGRTHKTIVQITVVAPRDTQIEVQSDYEILVCFR